MPTQAHLPLRGILRMLAPVAFSLLFSVVCQAADAAKQSFDLPAGDAEKTLKLFTQQSGEQILYPPTKVSGIQTNAVKGEMTAGEVLYAMLDKTQLVAIRDDKTGAYTVQKAATVAEAEKNDSSRPASDRAAAKTEDGVLKLDTFEVFGRKSLNMDVVRSRDDVQPYVIFDRAKIDQSGAVNLEDFLRQRLTMNASAISQNQLPSEGTRSSINLRGLGANQTLILIDGHRAVNTVTAGTPGQPDINGIPLAAIERIEVLPTTASGIYGGGATGGVINIILRRDYIGSEVKLTYENTFESDTAMRRVDFSAGFTFGKAKTNLLISGSYADAHSLALQDRDIVGRARRTIIANNAGNYQALNAGSSPPVGLTPNIRSQNGSNLVLFSNGTSLNSPITFIPVGYSGTTDGGAALVANAGKYNLELPNSAQSSGGQRSLVGGPTTKSLMATARHDFTPNVQVFVEGSISSNRTDNFRSTNFTSASYTVAATAPNNPFNQPIVVTIPISVGDDSTDAEIITSRVVAGALFTLPKSWKAETDYTWGQSETRINKMQTSPLITFFTVLPPAIGNGSINVLRDLNAFPIDLSAYVSPTLFRQEPRSAETSNATLRLSGPVGSLPAGVPMVSTLFEHRSDKISAQLQIPPTGSATLYPDRSQSNNSAYVEVNVPIVSSKNRRPLVQELQVQLAGRHDEYTINGVTGSVTPPTGTITRYKSKVRSSNPTLGLRYQPFDDLALRASYGTGFLPPTVSQFSPSVFDYSIFGIGFGSLLGGVRDPMRGDELLTHSGPLSTGGNPNLRPEKSESWSAGAILTPRGVPGLRISIDWMKIKKRDNIVAPAYQAVVSNEALFPGRITRGPVAPNDPYGVGPIIAIDATMVNIARAEIEAYDVQVDYDIATESLGNFQLTSLATWQTHYKTQVLPTAPVVENIGLASGADLLSPGSTYPIRFRATGGVKWNSGPLTLGWNARYFGKYLVAAPGSNPTLTRNQGNDGRVSAQIYHDFFASYRFARHDTRKYPRWATTSGLELQVGIKNVFNAMPPFDATSANLFYSPFGDPRLAGYYISLKKEF